MVRRATLFLRGAVTMKLPSMHRSFTPFPGKLTQIQVAVEGASDILLTQETVFGPTSMVFQPETARQLARTLLRAADAAEGRSTDGTSERKSVVPRKKLAAVR